MAQPGQQTGAQRRLLGQPQRGLGRRQRDALVGLARDAALQDVQLHEHAHLGAQHLGHHRRRDVVDRAQRVAARGLHLVGVRGDEDDGRVRGALVAADQRGRLEAVHVRHVDVQQDHGEVAPQDLAQRVRARTREHDVLVQIGQHRLEHQQLLRQVVDDQDVGAVGRLGQRAPQAGRRGDGGRGAQRHSHPRSTDIR